jgi:gluconolactonase
MQARSTNEPAAWQSEKVVANLGFVDGMVWSRSGFLAVADVRQSKIFRFDSDPKPKVLRDSDGGASGLAYDSQGRLHICESQARRVTRVDAKGKVDTLAETFEGKKLNAPNDIIVRKDGHVYFTDPAFGSANDHRELDFYGIWHVTPKGELDVVAKWQTRPNGIALSADGKALYVSDSDRHTVVAFDVDRAGQAASPRDVIRNVAGVPGGIRTDVEGRFYIAAKGVAVYSAQGKLERTLLESDNAANCTFGEGDFESLFIASRGSIYRVTIGTKGAVQY